MPETTATAVQADLSCAQCSYNLRTLSPTALCPECGTPVVQSAAYHQAFGDIRFARIKRGALLLALYSALVVGERFIIIHSTALAPPRFVFILIPLLMDCLLLAGIFMLATCKAAMPLLMRRQVLLAAIALFFLEMSQLLLILLSRIFTSLFVHYEVLLAINTAIEAAEMLPLTFLLIAATRLMLGLAHRLRRPSLIVLTSLALPLCALTAVATLMYRLVTLWQLLSGTFDLFGFGSLYAPLNRFLPIMYLTQFFYWLTVALMVRRPTLASLHSVVPPIDSRSIP